MNGRRSRFFRGGGFGGLFVASLVMLLSSACADLQSEEHEEYLGTPSAQSSDGADESATSVALGRSVAPAELAAQIEARAGFDEVTQSADELAELERQARADAAEQAAARSELEDLADGSDRPPTADIGPGGTEPAEQPPMIISGSLEGDQILASSEHQGVPVVQGYNSHYRRHFLDIGGTVEDYGEREGNISATPSLDQVEWGRGRARVSYSAEGVSGQALIGDEGVVWTWNDRGRDAGIRYGEAVDAYMVGLDDRRINRSVLRRRGQQENSGSTYLAELYDGAHNRYVIDGGEISLFHVIEELPETPIKAYVLRDQIELPDGYSLRIAGDVLPIGEVAETGTDIGMVADSGSADALVMIPMPWARDAHGAYAYDIEKPHEEAALVTYRLERVDATRYVLETRLDGRWLMAEDRELPVVLDPTARWQTILENPGGTSFTRTEPFNACAVRSGSQFYLSAVPLEMYWTKGTVVSAASIYQEGFGTNMPTQAYAFPGASIWINNTPPLADMVEMENYDPTPPANGDPNDPEYEVVEVDDFENYFSPHRGTLLWTGIAGRTPEQLPDECDGGWFNSGWFEGCDQIHSARPGWWGEWPTTVFRAPSTGHGDFIYRGDGRWIRITMAHHRGFGSANWSCNGFAFHHATCPANSSGYSTVCTVYGRRFEGPLDGGFGSKEFPRVRLWYTETKELDSFDDLWTAELIPDANAPLPLPEIQDPNIPVGPFESSVHTYTFTARERGSLELQLRDPTGGSGNSEDIRTFVYLDKFGDPVRLCDHNLDSAGDPNFVCEPGRRVNFQIDNSSAATVTMGQSNDYVMSLPERLWTCQDGHVMVGLRAARRTRRRGFLWLQDQFYTTRVEPVCASLYPDREGFDTLIASAEGVWYGGYRPDQTSEQNCSFQDNFFVNGVRVRMGAASEDGIHGIQLRCGQYEINHSQLQYVHGTQEILQHANWGGGGGSTYNGNWQSLMTCGSSVNPRPFLGLRGRADMTCENRCVASIFGICLWRVYTCDAGMVRRAGPVCSIPSVVPTTLSDSSPEFIGLGDFDIGLVEEGDQIRFIIDAPGRNKEAMYSFNLVTRTQPDDMPFLTLNPLRHTDSNADIRARMMAEWEPAETGDIDYYESQLVAMCDSNDYSCIMPCLEPPCDPLWINNCPDGDTDNCPYGTDPSTFFEDYRNLPMNTCYSGFARAVGPLGPGPAMEVQDATLVKAPVPSDIEEQMDSGGTMRSILVEDNVASIRFRNGLLPNQASEDMCEGIANRTRFQGRLRPCNADAASDPDDPLPGFTVETALESNERELSFPAEALPAPGCYEVDIRYFNRRDRYMPDDSNPLHSTLTIRRWLDNGSGDLYQLQGTPLSTSEIRWEWSSLVGASEFEHTLDRRPIQSPHPGPVRTTIPEVVTTQHPNSTCQMMRVRGFAEGAEPNQGPYSAPVSVATLLPPATDDHFDVGSPTAYADHISVRMNFNRINSDTVANSPFPQSDGFTPGGTCSGSVDPTGNTGQAVKVEVKRCSSEEWFQSSAPGATDEGYQITNVFEFDDLYGPGCYDFRVTYRNQSNHDNEAVIFRRWLGINLQPVTASTNRTDGILVGWNQQPDVRYRVGINRGDPANPFILIDGESASTYLHSRDAFTAAELALARPSWPTWIGAQMINDSDRFLQWQAPEPNAAHALGYHVFATDFEGVQIPSTVLCATHCTTNGRLAVAPLTGYELDIGQADNWFAVGSETDPSYIHTNVPGPQIGVTGGIVSGSGGVPPRIGYVDLDGSEVSLYNGTEIQTAYLVRGVNTYGAGTPSTYLWAQRDLGEDFFQWQGRAIAGDDWINVGSAGLITQDFEAPQDCADRLYRLRRTNDGTDQIAYTDPLVGRIKCSPGPFAVTGGLFDLGNKSLSFQWTTSLDADAYAIVRDGPGGGDVVDTGINRSHSFASLAPNRCYGVQVTATNGASPDAFAQSQNATGFFQPPSPHHVEYAGLDSGTNELVIRIASSYVPGWADDTLCGPVGAPADVQNLTAITVEARACDNGAQVYNTTHYQDEGSEGLEFKLPFEDHSCLEVFALYRDRLGREGFGFKNIGEYRRPPTGTPDVHVFYDPDDLGTLGFNGQAYGLKFDWSPISGANGYFFELNGPPRITTAGGDTTFTAMYLQENTCYLGEATAYNFDGGNLQTGNTGQARMATMIRNPVFRSSIDESDFGAPEVSAPADSLTCKPDESWDLRYGNAPQTARVRIFNRPPSWTAEDGCAAGTNLTAFRYEMRRCDLMDGQNSDLVQSDWQDNPETADIPLNGHHCFEFRVQYRNMDGEYSAWSHRPNDGWPRIRIVHLDPPEDMVQVDAGYDINDAGEEQATVTWGFTDVSETETGWQVRKHDWSPNTNQYWCAVRTTTPAETGTWYECTQFVVDAPRGNEVADARVRAAIGNIEGDPNYNTPFPLIKGDMSERVTRAYTLVHPPEICGPDIYNCDATSDGFDWASARDFKLTSVVCNNDRTVCSVSGVVAAPETRAATGHTGARVTRQRIDVGGQPVVTLTQNECLPGHNLGEECDNGKFARRGYGSILPVGTPRYWSGRTQGSFTDAGLVRPGTYRYTITYYNGNGIPSASTSVDITLQCAFGSGLGVCADGFPGTIDVPAADGNDHVQILGNCQFPGWDGLERCDDLDWSCSGDPHTDSNGNPVYTPGAACGTCQGGVYVCDPDGMGQSCENSESGVNECGGCNTLSGAIGDACEELAGCYGELMCDPAIDPVITPNMTRLICDYDTDDLNVCGLNCLVIPETQMPGESCGVCDGGYYACTEASTGQQTYCVNPDEGLNSCNICSELEPGEMCVVPERSDGVPLAGQCAVGWVPETCPSDGVMECVPNDPEPEICNGLDDDCNSFIDDGAREPVVNILDIWAGDVGRPGNCDIVVGDPEFLCTAVRVRITNNGTDYIPEDSTIDLVAVGDGGTIPLILGEPLGRRVDANGSSELTICWENPTSFFEHSLEMTLSDADSEFSCIDSDASRGSRAGVTMAACGPERCDGYDSETGGLISAAEEPLFVCSAGQACGVDFAPATCTSDLDCDAGGVCNVHEQKCYRCRGEAVPEAHCANTGCAVGEICLEDGACVEGCWDDSDCFDGESCVMNRCVEIRSESDDSDDADEEGESAALDSQMDDSDHRQAGAGCAAAGGTGSASLWLLPLGLLGLMVSRRRRRR